MCADGGLVLMGVWGVDVLWADADAYSSGWNPAQRRKLLQEAQKRRELLDCCFVA
jgi:hypothetical protein